MKKLPKSIENRISEINAMIPQIDNLENFAWTYNGGTWPSLVNIEPIQVNGLKVTITAKDQKFTKDNFITKQTYKASNLDMFADNGLTGLKYDLSVILKAFKKALN
jgi:hypothetical protein